MKNKKLLICLLTVLGVSTCLGFAACSKKTPTHPSDSEVITPSPDAAPVLMVNHANVTLNKGAEYEATANAFWLGEDVTSLVNVEWSLGAETQEGIVAITSYSNGKATIKALSTGVAEVYAYTTIDGAYVNSKITVTVLDSAISFDSEEIATGEDGTFELKIGTKNADGETMRVDFPSIDVYRNGEKVENAAFEWSLENETVAKIENGKIVALRAGKVNLYGAYGENVVTVTLNVERATIRLQETLLFDLHNLRPAMIDAIENEVGEGVYLGTKEVGYFADGQVILNNNSLPTKGTELGDRELTVYTDQATYVVNAKICSMYITTAAELDEWYSVALANGEDGYYALGANIDYNATYTGSKPWTNTDDGYRWANPDNVGFAGIFDGQGYTIDGLKITRNWAGFVTLLQEHGVIKNVAFTNASLNALGGLVCTWGCGTIENVYVHFTGTVGVSGLGGAFMGADNARSMKGKMRVKNCLINGSNATLSGSWAGGYKGSTGDKDGNYMRVNDVYALGNGAFALNELAQGSANYGVYAAASEIAAKATGWDSEYWSVESGELRFKTRDAAVAFRSELTQNSDGAYVVKVSPELLGSGTYRMEMPKIDVYEYGELNGKAKIAWSSPNTAVAAVENDKLVIYSSGSVTLEGVYKSRVVRLTVEVGVVEIVAPSESDYYTFEGELLAYAGAAYTFKVIPTKAGLDDFIVLVNGNRVYGENGVYTIQETSEKMTVKVLHGYIEADESHSTSVAYNGNVITITNAVFAENGVERLHGNAYISAEYIDYMISQGYTKITFDICADNEIVRQACAKYTDSKLVAYVIDGSTKSITVDLVAGASADLQFWGQNAAGSGNAIRNQGGYLTVTNLTFSK